MANARVALLIATDEYTDGAFSRLRAPRHDVSALAEVLRDPEIGGYQVKTLVNEPSHAIRVRANELFTQADRSDFVLFYISGHGVRDEAGSLHFASTDTRRSLLASTAVHSQWIRELIDRSRAHQTMVWLDCCYGGAFPADLMLKAGATVDVVPQLTARGKGIALMTASTHLQFAFEPDNRISDETRPSVFTDAIVAGLRTGDADLNDDGEIDAAELYEYVYDWVKKATPNQTPTRNDQVTGQLFVAHSKRGLRVHPALPTLVRQTLRNSNPELRLAAVDILFRLANSKSAAEQEAADDTLRQLRTDADPALAAAATDAVKKLDGQTIDDARPPVPAPVAAEPADRARDEPPLLLADLFRPPQRKPDPDDPREPTQDELPTAFPRRPARAARQRQGASPPVTFELPTSGRWDGMGPLVNWLLLAGLTGTVAVAALLAEKDHQLDSVLTVVGALMSMIAICACWEAGLSAIRLGSSRAILRTQSSKTSDLAFRQDGRVLVCGGYPGAVWDTASWTNHRDVPRIGHRVAFSPNGAVLAAARTSSVRILQSDLMTQIAELRIRAEVLTFSPDGSFLATATGNEVSIWRARDWQLVSKLEGRHGSVGSLAFDPGGSVLASASQNTSIGLWSTDNWNQFRLNTRHRHPLHSVAFSQNGSFFASADSTQIRLWTTEKWSNFKVINNRFGGLTALAFSPVDNLLAYGSRPSSIKLLNTATGSHVRTLMGHRMPVTALAFSPDGVVLASTSWDGTVRLWRVRA